MIRYLLLFSVATLPEIPAQLTLDQAIAIALKSAPALQRAAARVQQSVAQERKTRSLAYPRIGISAAEAGQTLNLQALGIETNLIPHKTGPFQTVDARAEVYQELLNISTRDRGRAASETVKAAGLQAVDVREMLSFEVAVAFARALHAQASAGTLSKQVDLARRLHRISQDRLAQGVASKLDSTRSEIQLRNLEQAQIEAGNALVIAKLQLANLIHAEPSTKFELTAPTYQDLPPAASTRAAYRAAESSVKAAEIRLTAARHERYPTAVFRANYGQNGRAWNDNVNTFQVQGVLNIPIYTGGRTEAEIEEARARLAEAKADLEELRTQIETDTLQARAALEAAHRQLEIARSTVQLANDELQLSLERFTGGIADNTEVIDAQDRLSRSEDSVVKAAFRIHVAQAQLRRSLGASQ